MTLRVKVDKTIGSFNLNLDFESNKKTIAILGASGSGKSMTLKCISGLLRPESGYISVGDTVYFDSEKGVDLPTRMRKAGYMFQSYALFPHMTAIDNIMFPMSGSRDEKEKKAKELLNSFYIGNLAKRYPSQLSGGQKQRVAMARILATDPKIILLDEPFSALDGMLRWKMEEEIIGMIREYDIPTILVSHDRNEVYRICDEVVVLNNGQMEVFSDKNSVFLNPKTVANSVLVGFDNHSKVEVENGRAYASEFGMYLDDSIDKDITYIGVKASDIKINTNGEYKPFIVKRVIPEVKGNIIILNRDIEEERFSDIRVDISDREEVPEEGQYVGLDIDLNKAALIE